MSRMITVQQKGDFSKTRLFLGKCLNPFDVIKLRHYGNLGVQALKKATPVDTGLSRDSWFYEVEVGRNSATLTWYNDNYAGDSKRYTVPVVILLDNGHATKDGKWVSGRHFIEPALNPVIEACVNDVWGGLTK